MKQAHLIGRTKGLRPSQHRRLESIIHRRHPENNIGDQLTLERLAEQVLVIQQPLHMLLDSRGICRILFVGALNKSGYELDYLSYVFNRQKSQLRLISCPLKWHRGDLSSDSKESIVALDLAPISWLRFSPRGDSGGRREAALWQIDRSTRTGWDLVEINELGVLCNRKQLSARVLEDIPISQYDSKERVLLLTLTCSDIEGNERNLAELEGLVRSAGARPVAIATQRYGAHNPQTIWGKGKLEEVALEVRKYQANLVIVDRELTPLQVRNLELILDCPVMDRSELILDIFAQRASSSAGRLQVELAQLRYRMPRLQGRGRSLSRQGGGIGTRGPGETQLEKDRRVILRKIERLKKDLIQLKEHRSRLRNRRFNLPRVSLVGYTNVGKSSLLNILCELHKDNNIFVEDKLFATLDPTTRRLKLSNQGGPPNELLVTDTVGFIRELPAPLVEAFAATLEETLETDLLLLLVDLSNPDWLNQLNTVNELLDSLGVISTRQVVANKIDRCESEAIDAIRRVCPTVLYVSASSGAGLKGLKDWIQNQFWGQESESAIDHH